MTEPGGFEEPTRRFTGFWIPVEIIEAAGLTWLQRLLWAEIQALGNPQRGGCFASNEHLARTLDVGEGTVANGLTVLKKAGWIQAKQEPGGRRILLAVYPETPSRNQEPSRNREPAFPKSGTPLPEIGKSVYTESLVEKTVERKTLIFPSKETVTEEFLKFQTEELAPALDPVIEKIYQAYPRKIDKKEGLKSIRRALTLIHADELLKHVQTYALSVARSDAKYIPYPATWFNAERWKDIPDTTNDNIPEFLNWGTA